MPLVEAPGACVSESPLWGRSSSPPSPSSSRSGKPAPCRDFSCLGEAEEKLSWARLAWPMLPGCPASGGDTVAGRSRLFQEDLSRGCDTTRKPPLLPASGLVLKQSFVHRLPPGFPGNTKGREVRAWEEVTQPRFKPRHGVSALGWYQGWCGGWPRAFGGVPSAALPIDANHLPGKTSGTVENSP